MVLFKRKQYSYLSQIFNHCCTENPLIQPTVTPHSAHVSIVFPVKRLMLLALFTWMHWFPTLTVYKCVKSLIPSSVLVNLLMYQSCLANNSISVVVTFQLSSFTRLWIVGGLQLWCKFVIFSADQNYSVVKD